MNEYVISGKFPCCWEDFISNNKAYPNITITGNCKEENIIFAPDNWIDIHLTDKLITYERAKEIIQYIIDKPVIIIEKNHCMSI